MLDLNKPMQTRSGLPVNYIGKIAGRYVFTKQSYTAPDEIDIFHTNEQGALSSGFIDLDCVINVPEKRYLWVNIYHDRCYGYPTPEIAETYKCSDCITTMQIEIPDGDNNV